MPILLRRHLFLRRAAYVAFVIAIIATPAAGSDVVIGAKNSKVYHKHPQECGSAKRIHTENRIAFDSAEEAERAGRRLCKRCQELDRKKAQQAERKPEEKASESSEDNEKAKPATTDDGELPSTSAGTVPSIARITRILPGGTFELDIGEKVRLIGVTFPDKGRPCAKDAVRFADEQTQGRTVRILHDSLAGPAGHRDALGRRWVYLVPEPDGRDLGGELIFQGYTWLDRQARFARRPAYVRREEEAWRAKRGVWKPLEGEAGKAEVVTGRFAHHYHSLKCPHVEHLTGKMTLTVNEAKSRRLPPCEHYRARHKKPK